MAVTTGTTTDRAGAAGGPGVGAGGRRRRGAARGRAAVPRMRAVGARHAGGVLRRRRAREGRARRRAARGRRGPGGDPVRRARREVAAAGARRGRRRPGQRLRDERRQAFPLHPARQPPHPRDPRARAHRGVQAVARRRDAGGPPRGGRRAGRDRREGAARQRLPGDEAPRRGDPARDQYRHDRVRPDGASLERAARARRPARGGVRLARRRPARGPRPAGEAGRRA